MKRYSMAWWLAILPTTVVVGVPVFLLLGYQSDWTVVVRLAVSLVCALVVDVAIAGWLQSIAPTKVSIGPGERTTHTEIAAEKATVISGFQESAEGRVSVRGETWNAMRSPEESEALAVGMEVSVVDRDGLNLVVAGSPLLDRVRCGDQ